MKWLTNLGRRSGKTPEAGQGRVEGMRIKPRRNRVVQASNNGFKLTNRHNERLNSDHRAAASGVFSVLSELIIEDVSQVQPGLWRVSCSVSRHTSILTDFSLCIKG